jgi:hypothetical protein
MVGIGSIWLRIGTDGGLMWMRWWISGFHKMLGTSRVAAQLAASREGLSSMSEWVSEWVSEWFSRPLEEMEVILMRVTPAWFEISIIRGSYLMVSIAIYGTGCYVRRVGDCLSISYQVLWPRHYLFLFVSGRKYTSTVNVAEVMYYIHFTSCCVGRIPRTLEATMKLCRWWGYSFHTSFSNV